MSEKVELCVTATHELAFPTWTKLMFTYHPSIISPLLTFVCSLNISRSKSMSTATWRFSVCLGVGGGGSIKILDINILVNEVYNSLSLFRVHTLILHEHTLIITFIECIRVYMCTRTNTHARTHTHTHTSTRTHTPAPHLRLYL
jgi:hypothetical protein